jgi:hypothetical protein
MHGTIESLQQKGFKITQDGGLEVHAAAER